jgi:hypothetical protein
MAQTIAYRLLLEGPQRPVKGEIHLGQGSPIIYNANVLSVLLAQAVYLPGSPSRADKTAAVILIEIKFRIQVPAL